jgi:hypothetical protein
MQVCVHNSSQLQEALIQTRSQLVIYDPQKVFSEQISLLHDHDDVIPPPAPKNQLSTDCAAAPFLRMHALKPRSHMPAAWKIH